MGKVNKNQLAGVRGKADKADRDCLPRYNYSNGAGWKTSKKWEKKLSFKIKSKR